MTQSTASASEDESDYMNLWDSESGSSSQGTAFSANERIMSSLMRRKVNRHSSRDPDRRKAWVSEETIDPAYRAAAVEDAVADKTLSASCFDRDKFESLKAKVEELDLKLTDFEPFSDLKHSFSLLELYRSTTALSPPSQESKSNIRLMHPSFLVIFCRPVYLSHHIILIQALGLEITNPLCQMLSISQYCLNCLITLFCLVISSSYTPCYCCCQCRCLWHVTQCILLSLLAG